MMTLIPKEEQYEISGGKKKEITYWYTTSPQCQNYVKSTSYFTQPFAYAAIAIHKGFCSLCSFEQITFSSYLPSRFNFR